MKKIIVIILCFVIVIMSILIGKYYNYKQEYNKIKEENLEYEYYLEKEIYGTEVVTVINKAVNNNEINKIEKDSDGFYVPNDINSVKIDIKIIDNDMTYKMETLYNGGMTNFVQYYNTILFKCSKIEYNSKGRVSYLLFEQISV